MMVVSGTGRSGTSLWMQVLAAAGFTPVGEAMPDRYRTLEGLNPEGFFESTLSAGVNFSTNPDPRTGALLRPEESRRLAVKIFSFGLRRTERAFLDRVLLTVRSWRGFGPSFARLAALDGGPMLRPDGRPVDPALWWFTELSATLDDARRRGYPLRVVPFEATLADPEAVVGAALRWLEQPCDVPAGVAAVRPDLTSPAEDPRGDLPPAWTETLDAFYENLAIGAPYSASLAAKVAALQRELREAQR